jgi:ribosomal protein L11 methyltransferase
MSATVYQFKIPVEQLEKITLALTHLEVQNYALFENDDSPKSTFCDADGFPIAQEFFLETDEQIEALKALGFTYEQKELTTYQEAENEPINIGPFTINPKQIPIYLEGSMAFGTGHHQTTKLCIMGLEILKNEPIHTVFDLGSGTGVLAIAAAKYFKNINLIHASDIDPIAVEITEHNFALNHIKAETFLSDGFQNIPNITYDLIIANILLNPLCSMASDIINHTAQYVILSGIIESQKVDLLDAFSHLNIHTELQLDEWCMLILKRK